MADDGEQSSIPDSMDARGHVEVGGGVGRADCMQLLLWTEARIVGGVKACLHVVESIEWWCVIAWCCQGLIICVV